MQGLALRGHWDDHIEWDGKKRYQVIKATSLHLFVSEQKQTKPLRNTIKMPNTCQTIQDELIDNIGKCIQMELLDEVKEAKFYSIIADEVCDVSNKEQLSLCLRYVQASSVKDRFLDLVQVERITGRVLASAILQCLRTWGLPLCNLRG